MNLDQIWSLDGPLAAYLPDFEHRREQVAMAKAILKALRTPYHLMVEAGTGVGKSLAYLVPFAQWALEKDKRVVLATYTKALQHQLIEKDLPILKEALGLDLRFALCVGGQNYLCLRRLNRTQQMGLFDTHEEVAQFQKLLAWASTTSHGINSELDFEVKGAVWGQMCREGDLCLGRQCTNFGGCFFQLARREQSKAHFLVSNHHLFFANLAAEGAVLPTYHAVVFDEAQNLEEVAANYLGSEISNTKINYLLEALAGRRNRRGVLQSLEGLPASQRVALIELVGEVRAAADVFFDSILEGYRQQGPTVRLRRSDSMENSLQDPLRRLGTSLEAAQKDLPNEEDQTEVLALASRCCEFADAIKSILTQDRDDWVYWLNLPDQAIASGRSVKRFPSQHQVRLCMAPIKLASLLRSQLFDVVKPVVMTSATLAVSGSFTYLQDRLGCVESHTLQLGSPFDYERQVMLYVAEDLPDPSQRVHDFQTAMLERTQEILEVSGGSTFVLFTSYSLLHRAADELSDAFPQHRILVQGEKPSGKLVDEFRRHPEDSVLLGTSTFWQGVDVPGEALQCVIITKLPFAVPDDPLTQARMEMLEADNRNPFYEYQVPQAVILFRQGFGRLIRSNRDFGVVALLDPRAQTKSYGRMFLDSLPDCGRASSVEQLGRFLEKKRRSSGE